MDSGSIVLVHGAGSGPWIFDGWSGALRNFRVVAVDLQSGIDPAAGSMTDYAGAVALAARALPRPIVLCGWSMGGMVALMAAPTLRPGALVLIESSPPAEIQGSDDSVVVSEGTFDPEEVYGAFPVGVNSRPESQRARDERKKGISIPLLPCPTLVVYGDEFRAERGREVAAYYGCDDIHMPGLDHWGLVLSPEVPRAIAEWLRKTR